MFLILMTCQRRKGNEINPPFHHTTAKRVEMYQSGISKHQSFLNDELLHLLSYLTLPAKQK